MRREPAIQLDALDVPLEDERALRVVLAEHRAPGQEHVEVPAGRIDERKAGVQREVEIAVLLEAGARAAADAAQRASRSAEYSVNSAPLSGWLMSSVVPVCWSEPTPFSTRLPMVTPGRPAGQDEAAGADARRAEELNALLPRGASATTNDSVGRDVEPARLDDAPRLLPDLDELARAAASRRPPCRRCARADRRRSTDRRPPAGTRAVPRTGRRCAGEGRRPNGGPRRPTSAAPAPQRRRRQSQRQRGGAPTRTRRARSDA